MKSWRVLLMASLLVAAPLAAHKALATTIDVGPLLANPSFETAAIASGTSSTVCPTSWSCSSTGTGKFYPTSSNYTPGSDGLPGSLIVPDGNQVANVFGNLNVGEQIFQQLSTTYQTGNIYTFTFWYGHPSGFTWPTSTITVQLLNCGSGQPASLKQFHAADDPGAGQWASATITCDDTTGTVSTGHIGVQFSGGANQVAGSEVNFDIAPAAAAVPEPASLLLLGSGLLSMAGVLSRKRRTKL